MKILKYLLLAIPLSFFGCGDNDDGSTTIPPSTFTVSIENVTMPSAFFQSGVFNTPVGATEPAPLFPGDAYEFSINAGPNVLPGDDGTRLSFITMFVQSNDLFYAPDEEGIALYDAQGNPVGENGPEDVTNQVELWDAGTEVNETTGGPSQKPQQGPEAEDVGIDENGVVTLIENNTDAAGNTLPNNDETIKVTIEYTGNAAFKVRIENVSDMNTIEIPGSGTAPVPLSPGAYVVHTQASPLFEAGAAASGGGVVESTEGVENIAEDGFPEALAADVTAKTGLIVPLSPGAYAVHESGVMPLYMAGSPDFGEGLEAVAEDGIPADLAASLTAKAGVSTAAAFDTPVGASAPGAIGPGASFEFSFEAVPGDRLSLATMFVQSNDWFYAFSEEGLALFDGDQSVNGDVTSSIFLYDAGTEIDEVPGAGLNQVIRQSGSNEGPADNDNTVRLINDSSLPATSSIIKVTITPSI